MKYVIIGTAGHVDHGKTKLIAALTGIQTDRLQEEQKRGITIDLGFAHLEFDDGIQAGIVDVPGHEKFIKNMLAGAGGMDLAMLVVAADEGVMPQTQEHLEILNLLGIRTGLVVLTKTDLVDEAWCDMVQEDVRERLQGTFLEQAPIVPVSAVTGAGMDTLRQTLHTMAAEAAEKDRRIPFRLPIDRVFSVEGFGTVVTGTLAEGCIHVNDLVTLEPSGQESRVRTLQVHGQSVQDAYAGQRVAINLAGLKKSDVHRGEAVCQPASIHAGLMLDVRLQVLRSAGRTIVNGTRLHLFHGAASVICKVILLGEEQLKPGQTCYAQLRLEEPLAAKPGDRFVVRFLSPVETVGGGIILDDQPRKHKHKDMTAIQALQIREQGSDAEKLLQALLDCGEALPTAEQLHSDPSDMETLCSRGKAVEPVPGRYLAAQVLDDIWGRCRSILERYHETHPLHAGIQPAELRQKLLPGAELAAANGILNLLIAEGNMKRTGERYALRDFDVHLTRRQRAIRETLLHTYQEAGLHGPSAEDALRLVLPKEREDCRQVLDYLLTSGQLLRFSPQLLCHKETYQEICKMMETWYADHETLTLGEFRDLLGTSRDNALSILEYFDARHVTVRVDNARKRGNAPIFY